MSLWSISIGVGIIFTTNELEDRTRNFKSNASQFKDGVWHAPLDVYTTTHTRDKPAHTGWYPASSMTPRCGSTISNTVWSTSAQWMPTRGNQRILVIRGGGQAHTRAHNSHKKIKIHRDFTPSKIRINRVFSQAAGTFIVIEYFSFFSQFWQNCEKNVPQARFFSFFSQFEKFCQQNCEKNVPQARFLWSKMRRRQDLWNKMRHRPDFLSPNGYSILLK